jgi:hypothetical protein
VAVGRLGGVQLCGSGMRCCFLFCEMYATVRGLLGPMSAGSRIMYMMCM